jgi:hypothetical protein
MTAQESILQNAYETTLALAIGADATETSVQVNSAPVGTPSASNPMFLVIDPDSDATREYIKVTSRSGVSLTVVRNIDTDSGGLNAHAVGAKVRMVAMNDRVDTIMNSDGTAVNTSGLVKDEDNMASDSATHLATQQSIKAYVDSQVTAQDLDFQADSGGALNIDLDSETLTIAGGTGIDTTGSGNQVSVDIDSTVTTNSGSQTLTNKSINLANNTLTGTLAELNTAVSDATLVDLDDAQTLTNKTIDADNNTVSNLEVDNLKSGVLDTDLTSVSASDDTLASAKSIKTYVDAQVASEDTIAELNDTNVVTPAAGHVLIYDATTSLWDNNTLTAGTNVTITNADGSITIASTDTNTQLTQEEVEDYVAGLLVAGSNVSLTYDDAAGTLTIASTDTQLSQEQVEDYVAGLVTAGSNITVTYDDTAGTLTIAATDTQLTQEQVEDYVGGLVAGGTGITATYDDAGGSLTIAIDATVLTTSSSVDSLSDVDTSTVAPTNGQALLWSSADSEWQPGDVASSTAAKIIDADGDTQIQTEESADEDILRFDTAGVERATLQGALDLTDNGEAGGIALTTNGGIFRHHQTQAGTYTVAANEGSVMAGPITITGTVTNNGTLVVI